jgi:hypothetical protein
MVEELGAVLDSDRGDETVHGFTDGDSAAAEAAVEVSRADEGVAVHIEINNRLKPE